MFLDSSRQPRNSNVGSGKLVCPLLAIHAKATNLKVVLESFVAYLKLIFLARIVENAEPAA